MTAGTPRLVFTAAAANDLVRLRAFIAEHDPAAARRMSANLIKRVELLRTTPLIGSIVAAAPDPEAIRDMVFGDYIVRYAVTATTVAVLRVWHHFEQRDAGQP
ncbi:MAG: type II toxin-antitoxin system RelE/ParE family toxin [Rhodanobacteraceae bacterium]